MRFPLFVARRYFFSRRKSQTISLASWIAVLGIAVTTAAIVCILSVFNGFRELVNSKFTAFDPELELLPASGRTFDQDSRAVEEIRKSDMVEATSAILTQKALARYGERQLVVDLMGVDDDYARVADVEQLLYGSGRFVLHADVLEYGIPGLSMALYWRMDTHFYNPIQIYAPRAGERINQVDLTENFNHDELNSAGVVFEVKQKEYDEKVLLCSLGFAQRMFEKEGEISALAIKLRPGISLAAAKRQLGKAAGDEFVIADRYEQHADIYRIMKTEKYVAYLFLCFILLTICFNIIGSVAMLMIDKRDDIRTMYMLGAKMGDIRRVFLYEGRIIALCGTVIGTVVGLLLCWLQQTFGLIRLGSSVDTFIIDFYPIRVEWTDIALVFVTVIVVANVVSLIPVRYLSKKIGYAN